MKRLLPLLAAFTFSGTVLAAADEKLYTHVLGAGSSSCGTWTEARRSRTTIEMRYLQQWVDGCLSGASIAFGPKDKIDMLADTDAQGVFAWIDNYCLAHPLDALVAACDVLGGELLTKAWRTKTNKAFEIK